MLTPRRPGGVLITHWQKRAFVSHRDGGRLLNDRVSQYGDEKDVSGQTWRLQGRRGDCRVARARRQAPALHALTSVCRLLLVTKASVRHICTQWDDVNLALHSPIGKGAVGRVDTRRKPGF